MNNKTKSLCLIVLVVACVYGGTVYAWLSFSRTNLVSDEQSMPQTTLADKLTQSDSPSFKNPENYATVIAADVVGFEIPNKGTMTVSDGIVSIEYRDYNNQTIYTLEYEVAKVSELNNYHRQIDENDNSREALSTKLYLSEFNPDISIQENVDSYITFVYVEFAEASQTSTV